MVSAALCFLRVEVVFFFQLLNPVDFAAALKTSMFRADVPAARQNMGYRFKLWLICATRPGQCFLHQCYPVATQFIGVGYGGFSAHQSLVFAGCYGY
jgi:hypothetical protein